MRVCTSFHCYCNSVNLSVIGRKERRKRTSPFLSILRIELITAWFVPGNYVLVKNNQCIYLNTLEEKIKYTIWAIVFTLSSDIFLNFYPLSHLSSFSNISLSQTSLYLEHLFSSNIPLSSTILYPKHLPISTIFYIESISISDKNYWSYTVVALTLCSSVPNVEIRILFMLSLYNNTKSNSNSLTYSRLFTFFQTHAFTQ